MTTHERASLSGWLIGVLTTIAIGLAAWCLHQQTILGTENAVVKNECANAKDMLTEIRSDVKELRKEFREHTQK